MKKRSKRYTKSLTVGNLGEAQSLDAALELLASMAPAKFDETVELAMHLEQDSKQSDQSVRGIVKLPHGSGKSIRVLVFTESPQEALDVGADYAGLKDLIEKIQSGWCDFDIAIATTVAMKEVRSIAKVLGPRGLMPSPKAGTVSDDVQGTIREVKAGRYEFKMDKTGNVALVVGKRSFKMNQLRENIATAFAEVRRACPDGKENFILSATLSGTMTPGISLELKTLTV